MSNLARYLTEAASTPFAQFLVDAAAKVTVLLAVAMVVTALLRRSSAALRHRIWCLTFGAILVLPGLSAALPEWRLAVLPRGSAFGHRSPLAPREKISVAQRRSYSTQTEFRPEAIENRESQDRLPLAERENYDALNRRHAEQQALTPSSPAAARLSFGPSALWLVGAVIALSPLIVGLARTFFLRRKAQAIDNASWVKLLDELRQLLALSRSVALYETEAALMPMTWGVLRPVVLLPRHARGWNDRQRRVVLLHELAHVKRCDIGFQLLGRVVCALYWFHPLAWYALRRLRVERELACDDCVVLAGERATDYAAELLQIARSYRPVYFAAAVAMAQRSHLERRLSALFDRARSHLPVSRRAARLLLAGVLTLVTTLAAVRVEPRAAEADDKTQARSSENSPSNTAASRTPRKEETQPQRLLGRVINIDGQAVVGAHVRVARIYFGGSSTQDAPKSEWLAETRSNADGRFAADFEPLSVESEIRARSRGLNPALVAVVTADGYGIDLKDVGEIKNADTEFRLVRDSSPIQGRLVDLQGRPISGAKINVRALTIFKSESDTLDDWLNGVRKNGANKGAVEILPPGVVSVEFEDFLHPFPTARTDDDGRFTVTGIGADRLAIFELEGPRIATTWLPVVTRAMAPLPLVTDLTRFATSLLYGSDSKIVAPPTQLVRGVVVDGESGDPLAGVAVRYDWNDTIFRPAHGAEIHQVWESGGVATTTDAEGRYELWGLKKPGGDEEIELSLVPPTDQPYFRTEVKLPRSAGLDAVTFDMSLRRAVTLRGQTTDAKTGEPVAAAVRYYPFLSNQEARRYPNFKPGVHKLGDDDRYLTDAEGRFVVPAVRGRGVLTVAARDGSRFLLAEGADAIADLSLSDGRQLNVYHLSGLTQDNAYREVDIPADARDFTLNVELAPLPVATLLLIDPDENPLVGVETQGLAPRNPFAGHWSNTWREPLPTALAELIGPDAGEHRDALFLHRARNLGAMVRFTPETIDSKQPVRIVLQPCGKLVGRLVDAAGQPVAGAWIHPEVQTRARKSRPAVAQPAWHLTLEAVQSGADGRFEIEHVPPGASYYLATYAEQREKCYTVTRVVQSGETSNLGDWIVYQPKQHAGSGPVE